jgi:hypothetical protein
VRSCSRWSSRCRHRCRASASATAALPPSCRRRHRCLHFYSCHHCHCPRRASAAAAMLPPTLCRGTAGSVGHFGGQVVGRLVGWSVGWSGRSVGWSAGWLVSQLVGRLVCRLVCRLVDWSVSHMVIGCLVGRWVGWLVGRLVGRLTDLPEVAGQGWQGSRDQMQHLVCAKPPNGQTRFSVALKGKCTIRIIMHSVSNFSPF